MQEQQRGQSLDKEPDNSPAGSDEFFLGTADNIAAEDDRTISPKTLIFINFEVDNSAQANNVIHTKRKATGTGYKWVKLRLTVVSLSPLKVGVN